MPKYLALLSQRVIEDTREWAGNEFCAGEWQPIAAIQSFIMGRFGYAEATANVLASAFITRGVENDDFERGGRVWRWKVHAPTPETQARIDALEASQGPESCAA